MLTNIEICDNRANTSRTVPFRHFSEKKALKLRTSRSKRSAPSALNDLPLSVAVAPAASGRIAFSIRCAVHSASRRTIASQLASVSFSSKPARQCASTSDKNRRTNSSDVSSVSYVASSTLYSTRPNPSMQRRSMSAKALASLSRPSSPAVARAREVSEICARTGPIRVRSRGLANNSAALRSISDRSRMAYSELTCELLRATEKS
mmetsp:Transcript_8413/g.19936  ORF Transcript_8413/g.19936 Transcript_8413/m.19936 type:complete len:206 (+) Transcript_8413:179-796(+)